MAFAGFDYFENRITGNCPGNYSCEDTYQVLSLVRAFDPAKAAICVPTPAEVNALADIKPIAQHNLIPGMIQELPQYLSLAAVTPAALVFDRGDITEYTKQVLEWWRTNYTKQVLEWWRTNSPTIPSWALAARIVFSLADQLQGAAMLNYNKRIIG